jgi:hypothetical protein
MKTPATFDTGYLGIDSGYPNMATQHRLPIRPTLASQTVLATSHLLPISNSIKKYVDKPLKVVQRDLDCACSSKARGKASKWSKWKENPGAY